MKNFKFHSSAIQHIYQRAIDKGVVFYTDSDRLVYYTLAAVHARKQKIRIGAAALMFTHTHQSVLAPSLAALRSYLQDTNSSFSRRYNQYHQRKGFLVCKNPGRAEKKTSKEKRSNIIYVYNNHVEKKLCKTAIEERWSFLAYVKSDHPFSEEIDFKHCSKTLRKATKLVDRRICRQKGLWYSDFDRILPNLNCKEYEQFLDYIISRYKWIDFSIMEELFGNVESAIIAIDSSTGSEYEITEEFSNLPDTAYTELVKFAKAEDYFDYIFSADMERKKMMMQKAIKTTKASAHHLKSFFHT